MLLDTVHKASLGFSPQQPELAVFWNMGRIRHQTCKLNLLQITSFLGVSLVSTMIMARNGMGLYGTFVAHVNKLFRLYHDKVGILVPIRFHENDDGRSTNGMKDGSIIYCGLLKGGAGEGQPRCLASHRYAGII